MGYACAMFIWNASFIHGYLVEKFLTEDIRALLRILHLQHCLLLDQTVHIDLWFANQKMGQGF